MIPQSRITKKTHLILLSILLLCSFCFGFHYGEHKEIGDQGFSRAIDRLVENGYYPNRESVMAELQTLLAMTYNSREDVFSFSELSFEPNYTSYGVINGLSGDHEAEPLSLDKKLRYRYSELQQIVNMHHQQIKQFKDTAPDMVLQMVDLRYGLIALINFSHFYEYGHSFAEHVEGFDIADVDSLKFPRSVQKLFSELTYTNAIRTYLTSHTFAIYMAELAGKYYPESPERSGRYLYYALLYNGFADHFLQDCFSSGHVGINRTFFGSIINNRAMHDFFSENGLEVINLKGEIWRQYGDGYFNKSEATWMNASSYDSIEVAKFSKNARRTIEATAQSIYEVWQAFEAAKQNDYVSFLEEIPAEKSQLVDFFVNHFGALSLIPLPYNSNLERYNFDPVKLPKLRSVNRRIRNRNFIRSRVANSLLVAYGSYVSLKNLDYAQISAAYEELTDQPTLPGNLDYAEIRFTFGRKGSYTDVFDKAGTTDFWYGPTVAFAIVHTDFFSKIEFYQFRGGLSSFLDVWVSNSRYLGIYNYLDLGVQTKSGRRTKFLFNPSIGLQPGPLVGLDNFTLPQVIWLPLRFLIPIKFRVGVDIVPGQRPRYHFVGDIDVLF